jgi:hypothetical protein
MTVKSKRKSKPATGTPVESVAELQREFIAAASKLWPVAGGSLSLRKNSCVRAGCAACASGEGHPAYGLWGRRAAGRFASYVPRELAGEVEEALANGRALQELVMDLGVRYVQARKAALNASGGGGESRRGRGRRS